MPQFGTLFAGNGGLSSAANQYSRPFVCSQRAACGEAAGLGTVRTCTLAVHASRTGKSSIYDEISSYQNAGPGVDGVSGSFITCCTSDGWRLTSGGNLTQTKYLA